MRVATVAVLAALLVPAAAAAQTAKENSAPSGMFGDGTTKWQMFRFIEEDQERTAALRAGQDPAATGSIQGSANSDSVRRPGEFGRRRPQ
jgi:hypothetical protein